MAGAMRKMGIYLGLVEDDDARAYGRYDTREAEADHYDRLEERRYSRYAAEDGYAADARYDDRYDVADRYEPDYRDDGYRGDDRFADLDADLPPAPDPEPLALPRRPAANRNLGLAPTPNGASAARLGGLSGAASVPGPATAVSGPVGAAGLAVREPVAATPERAPAPAPAPQPYRITTLHPRTYNEARQIGESFRDGKPVIMNLTEMDDADAKRLVDFAAGLSFGLRGSIERVTNKVFLLSPRDVDVTAEDKARIREGGFAAES
ncbi:cell division inhibitor SepF [Geodermatophilus africanus]|uniref:Cell division protein SepF n=1 Tax=Geodermatophilus africanus TaxID=1137993 RepID=A0A1H3HV24_9ACTN|nr:cell division protein SepF [Geodermatophilus africanus]SDY19356.1 cell division inhibitor SepF [Geodermatophilus africanus]